MSSTNPFVTTNRNTTNQIRQVDELIEIMSPVSVPFLKLVGIDGEAGTNPKLEWLEDVLLAETSLVVTLSSTTGTSLVVTTGDGVSFQPGEVIQIEDEFLYITAVNTDTLTVVRAVAGTSAATHAAGAVVQIVGLANLEGNDAPVKSATELSTQYNYFQAFDMAYKISLMQQNTDVYGIPEGDDDRELEKAFKEIAIKLELAAILGKRTAPATVDGNSIPRLMGGLDYFFSSSYGTGHYSLSLSSAQLQEKHINDMLQDRFYTVGQENMGTTLLMGAWNKRRIADIYTPMKRSERNERRGGVVVDTIDTEWGPIDCLMSLRVPKSKIYLVNLDYISIHPYKNASFFDEEKASSGAYTVRQIYGIYTMKCKNTRSGGLLSSTATSA